jgi:hypothetical protein
MSGHCPFTADRKTLGGAKRTDWAIKRTEITDVWIAAGLVEVIPCPSAEAYRAWVREIEIRISEIDSHIVVTRSEIRPAIGEKVGKANVHDASGAALVSDVNGGATRVVAENAVVDQHVPFAVDVNG